MFNANPAIGLNACRQGDTVLWQIQYYMADTAARVSDQHLRSSTSPARTC